MSSGAIAIAVLVVLVGFAIGVLGNWLSLPSWLTGRKLVITVCALLIITTALGVVLNAPSPSPTAGGSSGGPAGEPSSAMGGVAALMPSLVHSIVLSTDDSSGSYVLFSSRLDGSERQMLWDGGGPMAVIPGSGDLLLPSYESSTRAQLAVRTITGGLARTLTNPPPLYVDDSPSLAAKASTVYFIRHQVLVLDSNTSTFGRSQLMRVPLSGRGPVAPVSSAYPLETVSASANGRILAGECHLGDPGNVGQACLYYPSTGRMSHIPGSVSTTMSDVTVSPDGSMVAYSSFRTNPYGRSQVFIYDIRHNITIDLSQMAGINKQPSWIPSSTKPCLLFVHDLTGQDPSIYLGCLTPAPVVVPAISVGQYPVWYGR
jgi:Tol biopolymer transport system component